MSYLVLARKYRPQSFGEVVAQEHVTQTLVNAIAAGRVAHAILFAGPRGTGKTTVARILAKAMNCPQRSGSEPCNQCRSCSEITGGHSVDVFEVDGASNNSVDQVRELRENVKYMPAHSRYKIYIIDEVHMLSTPAFNALLKTLEEPPAHVLFIFATTEAHRIPITILSRCQRYDFRRLRQAAVSSYLAEICRKEGVALEPDSLDVIAHEAGGSIRDSLSLLDQVMACGEKTISGEQVLDILGVLGRRQVVDLAEAMMGGDVRRFVLTLEEVFDRGHDLKKVHADLVETFRNLLVIHTSKDPQRLVDLPPGEVEALQALARRVSPLELQHVLDVLYREEPAMRLTSNPRLALEMAFFKTRQRPPALTIEALIGKLDELRREVGAAGEGGGTPSMPPPRGGPEGGHAPSPGTPGGRAAAPPRERFSSARPGAPVDAGESPGESAWQRISARIAQQQPSLAAHLKKCSLRSLGSGCWEIIPPDNAYGAAMLRREKHMALLRQVCAEVLGGEASITVAADDAAPTPPPARRERSQTLVQQTLNHPLVAEAIDIFNGNLVDVQILQEADR
ncbi:MAG: DNA polymerase III subunit gamma/tau [Desulfobacterales bacterium]